LFSASWYRVSALTPRLRSHARIHRHRYRGETWYVLQDPSSDRFHRFSPAAYFVIGLMDGRRTVQELWDVACARLGDDAPTQDEVIQLLSQLHRADVLQSDIPPDVTEMEERRGQRQRRQAVGRLSSVLSWKIPLIDPDRWLRVFVPVMRPFFGWGGFVLWLMMVVPALVLTAVHWQALTENFADRVFVAGNLAIIWLVFPIVKAVHELGHAIATRVFGGEVHEMGVMVLVLTPIPYVDASSSSGFQSKWRRMTVGAAGMLVELFIAAGALYVWLAAEPGPTRAIAYDIVLIAGVSTILFNVNPLLRYDGYYILGDLIEIPNLRIRANAYMMYLVERYAFGREDSEPPLATPGERAWFVAFAVLSFLYRIVVVAAIMFYVVDLFFYLGLLLILITMVTWLVLPVSKAINYLFTNPKLRGIRARAFAVAIAGVAIVVALAGFVPLPFRTMAEGVVWVPEESEVRTGAAGFIERIVATPGASVRRGDVLLVGHDPALAGRMTVLQQRIRELEARYAQAWPTDKVRADVVLEELRYAREELARNRERAAALTVRAGTDGTLVIPQSTDLPGRFVKQGELLGRIVDLKTITVRTVVTQSEIDLVRRRMQGVDVRLSERPTDTVRATLRREVPGASETLPATALGTEGGGRVAVDPRDPKGVTTLQRVFELDLELPAQHGLVNVGGRVYVRFEHGDEPLARQWYWHLRQIFLARFNV
jgi:putative peptide zinc metalloprotease protein